MDGAESESEESIGRTESESEAFDFQPLPFQRNESLSTINDVMMSSNVSIPRSTIKNVEVANLAQFQCEVKFQAFMGNLFMKVKMERIPCQDRKAIVSTPVQ